MKHTQHLTLLICIVFQTNIFAQLKTTDYVPNEVIVQFKPEFTINAEKSMLTQKFNDQKIDQLNTELGLQKIRVTGNKKKENTYLLRFKTNQNINEVIKMYENTGRFEYVEPNYIGHGGGKQNFLPTTPDDTHFSRQYGLHNDGSFSLSPATADADVDMDLAWDIEQGDASVIVAVLDSGMKLDHPELSGRIWNNASDSGNGTDDDSNGYIDDTQGWDFVNNDNDPTDDHGHGTNVGGIIGVNGDNNLGYAGVDWNCKLMICKILDNNNSGQYTWWTEAIYYAVDNGAKVINMSVGGSGFSSTMQQAVDYAHTNGVTIVACMMNENNSVTYYPAGYQNTIAVGSTNPNDERSSPFFWNTNSGSNYGQHIDVVAPGNYIYGLSYNSNTNYESYWGGTSQATPLVAGICSLLVAQNPSITPDEIRTVLRDSAEDQVGDASEDVQGFDQYYGYGRVNAHQALLEFSLDVNDYEPNQTSISLFPNPSTEFVVINSKMNYNKISIIDMLGQTIYEAEGSLNLENHKISTRNFPNGTYIVQIQDKKGKKVLSKKLVIQ